MWKNSIRVLHTLQDKLQNEFQAPYYAIETTLLSASGLRNSYITWINQLPQLCFILLHPSAQRWSRLDVTAVWKSYSKNSFAHQLNDRWMILFELHNYCKNSFAHKLSNRWMILLELLKLIISPLSFSDKYSQWVITRADIPLIFHSLITRISIVYQDHPYFSTNVTKYNLLGRLERVFIELKPSNNPLWS